LFIVQVHDALVIAWSMLLHLIQIPILFLEFEQMLEDLAKALDLFSHQIEAPIPGGRPLQLVPKRDELVLEVEIGFLQFSGHVGWGGLHGLLLRDRFEHETIS
jgi:hypothetical protein